jgi:hypothetical protein
LKIFLFAIFIYVVWELEQSVQGIFDTVFWPLKPILQESNGSLHEWHFRTFLDHYSTLFGMIFAMNFPYLASWFAKVERLPTYQCVALKSLVASFFIAIVCKSVFQRCSPSFSVCVLISHSPPADWWYYNVFSLDKYEFNAAHPYWMWIPILAWIYFRYVVCVSFVVFS